MVPTTVDLICVVYNHPNEIIFRMIDSAVKCLIYCPYLIYKFHIINNGSAFLNEKEFQEHVPNPAMLSVYNHNKNVGYCGGNNFGISQGNFDYIIIVNPDIVFKEALCFDWIIGCAKHYQGIVGKLVGTPNWYTFPASFPTDKKYNPDDLSFFYNEDTLSKPGRWKPFRYIDGSLMAFPRKMFNDVGGFDDDFFPGYFGENAFIFKAYLKGYNIKDAQITKFYTHQQNHTPQEEESIKRWTKEGRRTFYTKYALEYWDEFLKYMG